MRTRWDMLWQLRSGWGGRGWRRRYRWRAKGAWFGLGANHCDRGSRLCATNCRALHLNDWIMCGWYYAQRKTASKASARRQKVAGGLRVLPFAPQLFHHSNKHTGSDCRLARTWASRQRLCFRHRLGRMARQPFPQRGVHSRLPADRPGPERALHVGIETCVGVGGVTLRTGHLSSFA